MTSLSWSIYAISTLNNFGVFALIGLVLSGISIVVLIICMTENGDINSYDEENRLKNRTLICTWLKRAFASLIFFGLLSVFIPSKEYLIMIAGAEVTNVALNQQVVKDAGNQIGGLSSDAINLLREYIKKQTEELNKKD